MTSFLEGNLVTSTSLGVDLLQKLLQRLGLSVEEAATELDVEVKDMRDYLDGTRRAPKYVGLALMRLLDLRETSR
jgi:hypothetical protein